MRALLFYRSMLCAAKFKTRYVGYLMKNTLLLSALSAALLLTACGKSDDMTAKTSTGGETEVVVDVTPELPSQAELTAAITDTNPNDKVTLMQNTRAFVSAMGTSEAKTLSNALWAGTEGFDRNRGASGGVAVAAYETKPEAWSSLRAGIAYTNGLGVEKDAAKAIAALSSDSLAENMGAHYFLAKAYEMNGQNELAQTHLQKAADMGHALAKKELEG